MNEINSNIRQLENIFKRYTDGVYPSKEKAIEMMTTDKKLSFYLGIDPTGPDIHLGHSTNFIVMKGLISMGHKIVLLIGDFTARIGDPTDKDATRKPLTEKQVKENMKNYIRQAQKTLPKKKFSVKYNSSWLKKMTFEDIIRLTGLVTVQQMIARDMFQKRLESQKPIGLHEFLYPLMQGYDSVAMNIDGEIGGTDQTFNMLIGRDLEKELLKKDKIVITTKLLENPVTGKKLMNKSEGTYIAINDLPQNMFGKVMALPDQAIMPLFTLATEISQQVLDENQNRLSNGENPKNIKKELATEIVSMYYGAGEAQKASQEFQKIFSAGGLPDDIQELAMSGQEISILELLEKLNWSDSTSETKRLIDQGGVSVNDEVIKDWHFKTKKGDVIKKGSRNFVRLV